MELTRTALARMIDHTLLAPTATESDVAALVAEATELGTWSVCLSPARLPLPAGAGQVRVASVVGFPSGQHTVRIKAAEAAAAVRAGAVEIDMVIDIGRLLAGDLAHTEHEVRAVREAVPAPVLLKVILETGALEDGRIIDACGACERAGADFVKTSTGFAGGGATVEDIALMRRTVGPELGVKASGGVRSLADAQAMIEAGATRLGASSGVAIVEGEQGTAGY